MATDVKLERGTDTTIVKLNGHPAIVVHDRGAIAVHKDHLSYWNGSTGQVKAPSPVQTRIVVSKSRPGVRYRVTSYNGNDVACTCEGFSYRSDCKHLTNK